MRVCSDLLHVRACVFVCEGYVCATWTDWDGMNSLER